MRATATKYPRWYDEDTDTWMPTSVHPAYEPCKKVFNEQRRGYAPESAIPGAWTGTTGVYNLVRFVDLYLPRRNPDFLHKLDWIERGSVLALYWVYKWPSWKRRHADPETLALHTPRNQDGTLDARDPWDTGALPLCCYPSAPEPHVWTEPGFLLPEGNPLRYVRRLPWWRC